MSGGFRLRSTTAAIVLLSLAWLCNSASAAWVFTFQEGVSGYNGTTDTRVDGTTGAQTTAVASDASADKTLYVYDREHFNDPNDLRISRALLRFDLTSLQPELANKTVQSVTLTITSQVYAFGTKGVANSLHQIAPANAGCTEAQSTWQRLDQGALTAWASGANGLSVAGTDYISTALDTQNTPNPGGAGPSDGSTMTFTLNDVSFITGWINNHSTNSGFLIRQPGDNTGAFDRFYSSEAATLAFRPLLTVTMVPEPSCMMAFGTVVLAASIRRRRWHS